MYNQLSFKIGILFFVFILMIESILFFTLYTSLANQRVEEVLDDLLARGNTHRAALEDHFERRTLDHVELMESSSDLTVVITDETGDVLVHSNTIEEDMQAIIDSTDYRHISIGGEVIEDGWTEVDHVATNSPIISNNEHVGHVFMFTHTNNIKKIVNQLGNHFLIASVITVMITVVTIFILSKLITKPIIRIKEATEQLSHGNHHVELSTARQDELGELADSITKLSKDLERLKNERHEFLASISHELRTPLTYIKGYADIVSRPNLSEEEREKYIQIIQEETKQLSALIKNLFDLAKVDQNEFVIKPKQINLKELIESLVKRVKPAYSEKDITLIVNCPKEIIVSVDPVRFQQVLLNVLDNARKHSHEGSEVIISAKQYREHIQIIIEDEGEGIPKEELPFLFDRLYRVEKSRSRQKGGTGLGLTIAREIIESHGGSINIESELGKGTDVIITLRSDHSNV
ncbi:sensor histidine kinase [Alkalibacillus aidingensis]|uniref:sensor histidine kinase n=1 Tax=Alkalibacillus aidingensis TaxID=2747607 RepID=UPI0016607937|nr:HAMP domain-containing sensor histidine kinase [Alkalibacillus aidingensis]